MDSTTISESYLNSGFRDFRIILFEFEYSIWICSFSFVYILKNNFKMFKSFGTKFVLHYIYSEIFHT